MSFQKPKLAEYVDDHKGPGVDLVELCRRLIAEWQYVDEKEMGQLVAYKRDIPAASNVSELLSAVTHMSKRGIRRYQMHSEDEDEAIIKAIRDKTYSKLLLQRSLQFHSEPPTFSLVTRKNFYEKGDLPRGSIDKLYWMMRMRWSCAMLNQAVGQIIPELKKKKYSGFLLPNGKTVTFDSLYFMVTEFVPKSYNVFKFCNSRRTRMDQLFDDHYSALGEVNHAIAVESITGFDEENKPTVHHVVMAFNLPDENDLGKGKLFILDQTCAQFQLRGPDGGLVFWGYWNDYRKSMPVDKITLKGFEHYNFIEITFYPWGPKLVKNVLKGISLPLCNYCGEVESKNRTGLIVLKKCSRCKEVSYCDMFCQKAAWKFHKLSCVDKKCEVKQRLKAEAANKNMMP